MRRVDHTGLCMRAAGLLRRVAVCIVTVSLGLGADVCIAGQRVLLLSPPEWATVASSYESYYESLVPECGERVSDVVVKSTTTLGDSDSDGLREWEDVKAWICQEMGGSGADGVVLFGDWAAVPPGPEGADYEPIDELLTDCDGDGSGDIPLGRMPVTSLLEATRAMSKTTVMWGLSPYHTSSVAWRDRALGTAGDSPNVGYDGVVPTSIVVHGVADVVDQVLPGVTGGCWDGSWKTASQIPDLADRVEWLTDRINEGAAIWFIGGTVGSRHSLGAFAFDDNYYYSGGYLDPALLGNSSRLTFAFGETCELGRLDRDEWGIGLLQKLYATTSAGIWGWIGSTGAVDVGTAVRLGNHFVEALMIGGGCDDAASVGQAWSAAKQAIRAQGWCDLETVASMSLFADPMVRLPLWAKRMSVDAIHPVDTGQGPHRPYPNQWTRRHTHWRNGTYPEHGFDDQSTWVWTASKGELCLDFPDPSGPGSGPLCEYEPGYERAWYRCRSGVDTDCSTAAQITVSVTEGIGSSLYTCNATDTTFAINFRQHTSGGCPIMQVWKNGAWTDKNSVLIRSAYDVAASVVQDDYYLIQEQNFAASPSIDFRVRESEQGEVTTLDYAQLLVVDHATSVKVWTSQTGARWQGTGPWVPTIVRIKDGPSLEDELEAAGDTQTIAVAEGDSVMAVFADTTGSSSIGLVMVQGRYKPEATASLQGGYPKGMRFDDSYLTGHGQRIMPRKEWYTAVADSPRVVRGDGIADTVVLCVGEYHELDQIALVTSASTYSGVVTKEVTVATHSVDGNVLSAVNAIGGTSTTLDYGEYVQIRFNYPAQSQGTTREWILRLRGAYVGQGQSVVDPGQIATRLSWGIQSLTPNPTRGDVMLYYNRGGSADFRLALFDVTGRTVRVLSEGEGTPGAIFVRWDGKDGRGRRAASGVYFLRMSEGDRNDERKVVLIR